MKNDDELLKAQVNAIIRDEIQEGINDYIDQTESKAVGFVDNKDEKLKVNIPHSEVDKIIKKYKRIKKKQKSNLYQAKLLDQHGKPL